MRRRVPRPVLAAVLVLTLLVAAGFGLARSAGDETANPAALPETTSSAPAEEGERVRTLEVDTAPDVAAPVRVTIPGIGVDSTLEDLRTDEAGRLVSPVQWQRAGWFADGVEPGAIGPAVIAGHVDSPTGPAVFADLEELRRGDVVEVTQEGGRSVSFEVDRTEVVGKDDFPTEAVYGPTPDAQLRLITCDGAYVRDSGGYQENLVVWATEAER